MRIMVCALLSLLLTASSQVLDIKEQIKIDGRLDEQSWSRAQRQGGFLRRDQVLVDKGEVQAQTWFALLQDEHNIYLGIYCEEPRLEELQKMPPTGMWSNDGLEIFLSPSGLALEYYQFLVTFQNYRYAMYYDESGKTRPDPYFAPQWDSAVYEGDKFWSCELRLPITAFYMTRQELWQTKWLVNIMRRNRPEREISSWSQLNKSAHEPHNFRSLQGFPKRETQDDIHIRHASIEVIGRQGKGLAAKLNVALSAGAEAQFLFSSPGLVEKELLVKRGDNQFSLPCLLMKEGRISLPLVLQRLSDQRRFERSYPVLVEYKPLQILLDSPQYRNNFYPGQDYGRISGTLLRGGNEPVQLSLQAEGLPTQTLLLQEDLNFSFDSSKMPFGTALLTARCGAEQQQLKIQRLEPSPNMCTWIENGNLMVDGRPTLRRNMYATYYMGGEAFKRRYDADHLHETRHLSGGVTLSANRLIPGIEAREGTKDVRPSAELLAKIDEVIEKNKGRDFPYYYISDEPECRGVSAVYLRHIYEYVAEKDPYHVILMASRAAQEYIDCADWFETHPYINPHINAEGRRVYNRDIDTLGSYLDEISLKNRADKCVGFLPSIYKGWSLYPTFKEVVCHTWAAMIHGGKSLWPYAYHDLGDRPSIYEGTRYIFSSFEALEEFILQGRRSQLLRSEDYEAVLYELPEKSLFVLVNFRQKPVSANIPPLKRKYYEFRGSREFSGGEFKLEPLEVLLGCSEKIETRLPAFKEVQALVDKLEQQRTNRGNLLFERENDLVITTSKPIKSQAKMFDGTLDVVAWYQVNHAKWYEVGFLKEAPLFNKVCLHGFNLAGSTLKIRKDGQWLEPAGLIKEEAEFLQTWRFTEAQKTVKIRFDFPLNRVELYEMELMLEE